MLGGVDRALVGVLRVALAGVLVEQQCLVLLDLPHPVIDAALGEQPVHLHGADLAHTVGAGG